MTIGEIKRMRREGKSFPEIASTYDFPKTTIFRYTKDVEVAPEFFAEWKAKRGGSRLRRARAVSKATELAKDNIKDLTDKEKLLILASLYWAEGNKTSLILMNSDPVMVKLFVVLLQGVAGVTVDRIRVNIRIYSDIEERGAIQYWSKLLNIPLVNFCRTEVIVGKKSGKLPYGMCRIRVLKGGDLLKYLTAIKEEVARITYPRSSTDRARVS